MLTSRADRKTEPRWQQSLKKAQVAAEAEPESEDDMSKIFSNDDSIETEEQSSNEDDFEAHRESCTMSDDGAEENDRKTIREKPESDGSDSDSYQYDDSIKEAGLYVTSIANLRRREMHGLSYLDMSNKDMRLILKRQP